MKDIKKKFTKIKLIFLLINFLVIFKNSSIDKTPITIKE